MINTAINKNLKIRKIKTAYKKLKGIKCLATINAALLFLHRRGKGNGGKIRWE